MVYSSKHLHKEQFALQSNGRVEVCVSVGGRGLFLEIPFIFIMALSCVSSGQFVHPTVMQEKKHILHCLLH